jgi:hypothetical protein
MNKEVEIAFADLGWGGGERTLALIKGGLDAHVTNDLGEPLILAAARSASWCVFDTLLKAGADPEAPTPEGYTAYHYAIAGCVRPNWRYWPQRCIRDSRKIARVLNDRGVREVADRAMFAIAMNRITQFRDALDAGLDVDGCFPDPSRVLLPIGTEETARIMARDMARRQGLGDLAVHLDERLSRDARIETVRPRRHRARTSPTLLMWTHALGRTPFSKLLLSRTADESLRDELGYTCYDYAKLNHKDSG